MNLDLDKLNDIQKQAVECTEGPCIVSAGAGSGKTRVLTYRVANLINNGIDPTRILAITFTNKAANEMRERLHNMLQDNIAGEPTICTFHALGVKILRECHNYISPRTRFFTIYDETDRKSLVKKIVKNINNEDKMVDAYIRAISNAKNMGIYPEDYTKIHGDYEHALMTAKVYKEYEIQMEKNNAYDFDDLLCKTYDLLKNNEAVKNYYCDKFKYILVDEFQDTNDIQYRMLRLLQSKHKNIFVVGDEDQSIYSWRGADSRNMLKFISDFKCNKIYKLEQNYRSTEKILNVANTIISKNFDRLDKNLWTENIGGYDIEYTLSNNEKYEAERIAQTIYILSNRGQRYKDIAILCRLNALTRVLEDKLLGYNIPYKIFGGVKFYDRMEVKNILAYLRCIVNNKDNESFLRIINFPKRKIGDVALKNLENLSFGRSFMDTLYSLDENSQLPTGQLKIFLSVKNLFERLTEKSREVPISSLVTYLLEEIDIDSIYDKKNEEDLSRLMNINELVSSIKDFEKQNEGATLEDYIQSITLVSDIDSYDTENESVTIATVHAVKGLEFKTVFIIGLEEGIFPLRRYDCSNSDEDLAEERRLMYVAVTRAKERLYLSRASSRFLNGSRKDSSASRYLEDLGYEKHEDNIFANFDDDYDNSYSFKKPNSSYYSNYNSNNYYQKTKSKDYYGDDIYPTSTSYVNDNTYSNINNSKPTKSIKDTFYTGNNVSKNLQKNSTTYIKGEIVNHLKYGKGTVVDFDKDENIVIISFEGIGVKKFDSNIVKLTKEDSSTTYTKGEIVNHAKYGKGIVVDFDENENIVTVTFAGIGIKKFDSKIAKLKINE